MRFRKLTRKPPGFRVNERKTGGLKSVRVSDAQVTSVVLEPLVQELDFTLIPPPLTVVIDVAQDRNNYIISFIREDGSRRVFTQEEIRENRPIRERLEMDEAAEIELEPSDDD